MKCRVTNFRAACVPGDVLAGVLPEGPDYRCCARYVGCGSLGWLSQLFVDRLLTDGEGTADLLRKPVPVALGQ